MKLYFSKYRAYAAMPTIVLVIWSIYLGQLQLKSLGFSSGYSRIKFLCMNPQFSMILEPGTVPGNQKLPPHLRLDQISYLDKPDTEIACPPMFDITTRQSERLTALPNQMEVKIFGHPVNIITTTSADKHRYVDRKLGAPEPNKGEEK